MLHLKDLLVRGLGIALTLFSVRAFADQPEWTKQNTFKRVGNVLTLVCKGIGPSLDLARKASIDSCKATAANEINGDVTIKSLSIETQSDATFHQEVSSLKRTANLSCDILNEYFRETDGSTENFILCRFDLTKSKVVSIREPESKTESIGVVKDSNTLIRFHENGSAPSKAALIQSSARHIMLTTIPTKCESLVIQSNDKSRAVRCDTNPMTVLINPMTDKEIIIRASGFLPKHLKLQNRKPSGYEEPTVIEVLLEK